MQIGNLISQRNIENIEKQYNERKRIKMINQKVSDKRNQIGENDEDGKSYDIKVLKLVSLSSKRERYNIVK